jgi:F0F1-type ATP synthase assembly protein I
MVAYILGVIALFQSKYKLLREWAYAGFTFAMIGAFLSHLFSGEPERGIMALISLGFLLGSYFVGKNVNDSNKVI